MKNELAELLKAADVLYENAEYNLRNPDEASPVFIERALNDFRLARYKFIEAAKQEGLNVPQG